jgi:virulence factor Mce-like protein
VRRGSASIAANPVLIGAATVLVVVVAVFLAYNANSGLPFVPTYQLKAELPRAASLVVGNEVRIGGTRVGAIEDIQAEVDENGQSKAVITMQLERAVRPLPVDTTVLVRARSVLGLKYVQLTKGNSSEGLEDGATIPLRQATPEPVEFDEFLQTFDDPTREAQQRNLREFGNGLTGRGADLNRLFENLGPLLRDITPVMRNLSDPETRLERLFRALGRTAALVAPVAEQQASVFRNLNLTVEAFADASRPYLQEAIEEGPESLRVATEEFPKQRPFLRDSELLFADLRPAARTLTTAAAPLADAIDAGVGTLARTPAFNRRVADSFGAIEGLTQDPLAAVGLGDLTTIVELAQPTITHASPMQSVCNYLTLFLRNAGNLLSDGGANGTWQRFVVIAPPNGKNSEQYPSSAQAGGGPMAPGEEGNLQKNFLHSNLHPFTASTRTAFTPAANECEAGNERYTPGRKQVGNPPGNQGTRTERTTRDEGVSG